EPHRDDLGGRDGEPRVEHRPLFGDAHDGLARELDRLDGLHDVGGGRVRVVVQERALAVGVAGSEQGEDLVAAAVPFADLDAAADDDAEFAAWLTLTEDVRAGQITDGAGLGCQVLDITRLQFPADDVPAKCLENRVQHDESREWSPYVAAGGRRGRCRAAPRVNLTGSAKVRH